MWGRRERGEQSAGQEADRCCLCGRAREEVALLVAGVEGAVCDGCSFFAVAALAGAGGERRPEALAHRTIELLLADLGSHAPRKTTGALVRAAVEVAGGDPALCRALADRALALSNPEAALAALAAIAPERREPGDLLLAALAHGAEGRPRRGLELLEELSPELLDDVDRADFVVARSSLARRAGLEPADSLDDLRAAVADIERARRGDDELRSALGFAVCELAACLVAAGRAAEAERELIAHRADLEPPSARYDLVRGDTFAALGRDDDARRLWARAAAEAHPESSLVREATERLRRGYR